MHVFWPGFGQIAFVNYLFFLPTEPYIFTKSPHICCTVFSFKHHSDVTWNLRQLHVTRQYRLPACRPSWGLCAWIHSQLSWSFDAKWLGVSEQEGAVCVCLSLEALLCLYFYFFFPMTDKITCGYRRWLLSQQGRSQAGEQASWLLPKEENHIENMSFYPQ